MEVGGHTDTVRTIVFSQSDGDLLCLSGGSDSMLKLWDLRQRKCIREYGNEENEFDLDMFHTDSLRAIQPNASFDSCFTGGRDGKIFHTNLVNDQHTLVYDDKTNPINSLTYDEHHKKLWFTSTTNSSLKCIDLDKRTLERLQAEEEPASSHQIAENKPDIKIN